MSVIAIVTPLLYALAVVVGGGVGVLFVSLVRESDREKRQVERVAKLAARRAVDETLRGIGGVEQRERV